MRFGAGTLSIAILLIAGCAARGHVALPAGGAITLSTAEEIAATRQLERNANITPLPLGKTASLSYQLVFVEQREHPHMHAEHDLAVTLLEGHGQLHIGAGVVEMKSGDVAFIARGTRHFFVNTGAERAVAFVVSAPPYDPNDNIASD